MHELGRQEDGVAAHEVRKWHARWVARLADAHRLDNAAGAQLQQRDSEATENDARGEPVFSLHGTTWQHNALWREHELGHG